VATEGTVSALGDGYTVRIDDASTVLKEAVVVAAMVVDAIDGNCTAMAPRRGDRRHRTPVGAWLAGRRPALAAEGRRCDRSF